MGAPGSEGAARRQPLQRGGLVGSAPLHAEPPLLPPAPPPGRSSARAPHAPPAGAPAAPSAGERGAAAPQPCRRPRGARAAVRPACACCNRPPPSCSLWGGSAIHHRQTAACNVTSCAGKPARPLPRPRTPCRGPAPVPRRDATDPVLRALFDELSPRRCAGLLGLFTASGVIPVSAGTDLYGAARSGAGCCRAPAGPGALGTAPGRSGPRRPACIHRLQRRAADPARRRAGLPRAHGHLSERAAAALVPPGPAGGAWPEAWQALARVAPPPLRPCALGSLLPGSLHAATAAPHCKPLPHPLPVTSSHASIGLSPHCIHPARGAHAHTQPSTTSL